MKHFILFFTLFASLPLLSFAQGLQQAIPEIVNFISGSVITFLIGIAFLVFVINIVRYFVIDGANEQSRQDAKMYALYSVLAFVFLVLFWGIINLLVCGIGIGNSAVQTSDYVDTGSNTGESTPFNCGPNHTNVTNTGGSPGGSNPTPTGSGSGGTGGTHSGPTPAPTGGTGGGNPAP